MHVGVADYTCVYVYLSALVCLSFCACLCLSVSSNVSLTVCLCSCWSASIMSASYSLTIFREEILKSEALKNISNAETVAIPPVVKLVLPGVQKKGGIGRLADYREIHVCICMRQGKLRRKRKPIRASVA